MQTSKGDSAITRPSLYGNEVENTYSGILSFMRRTYSKSLKGVDVAISGIPLDLATTYRSGARLGPAAIRAASVQLAELKPFPWGFDPFETLAVIDYGDCWFDAHQPQTIRESIKQHTLTQLKAGCKTLMFGGDHFITYPILQAYQEHFGHPVALIHFDAHSDTWPDDSLNSLNHGTMFYKAIQEQLIDVEHSIQIGIRTWNDNSQGIKQITAPTFHQIGINATCQAILETVGTLPCYLTIDIDCLDPAFAPGTGTPVFGGLYSHQLLELVRQFTPLNLLGIDIVEVAPAYDQSDITALAAAHIACDCLCVLAKQRQFANSKQK